jgi:hypothetical protein
MVVFERSVNTPPQDRDTAEESVAKTCSLLKNSLGTAPGAILFSFACSVGRNITANFGPASR